MMCGELPAKDDAQKRTVGITIRSAMQKLGADFDITWFTRLVCVCSAQCLLGHVQCMV